MRKPTPKHVEAVIDRLRGHTLRAMTYSAETLASLLMWQAGDPSALTGAANALIESCRPHAGRPKGT